MTAADGELYKMLIVGGGPSGVGVFIRAARTGFLARLLDPALHGEVWDTETSARVGMKQKGVAIVHDGDASTFGSGNLGNYVINSNTFARSLLSSVLDEKPDLDPPESIKETFLERVKDHDSTRMLEETGNAPVSLVNFGRFLQNVGACLLKEILLHAGTSKCLLNTRATRFERLESGVYRVEVTENERVVTLYTEHLVFAMGGKQELPLQLTTSAAYKSKSFLSDECLRDDGFARLREHLLQNEGRKVCIVGGSHSSFSVAWMLLNKGKQQRAKSPVQSGALTLPTDEEQGTARCNADASSLPDKVNVLQSPTSTADTDSDSDTMINADNIDAAAGEKIVVATDIIDAPTPRPSVCKPTAQALVFQPRDITILHRSPIRCYYFTRKEAEADGADGSRVDRTGCVNTFTGLREDSKHLYKDIKTGKESRVRLFQVNQHGCQNLTAKAYDSADAIVWCCGYSSRMLPGVDEHGKPFKFHEDHGVVKLDLQARIQLLLPTKAVVAAPNLYGVGLGFSLRSHVDEAGTETRADGVTVYHRRGATLVLAALFGSRVFGKDTQSFEEMVEKHDKNRKKKEPSVELSLADRIKRSSASSPLRTPTKTRGTSSNANAVRATSVVPVVVTFVSPARMEKPGHRRSSGKTPTPHAPASTNQAAAVTSPSATNPPVRMLLQRRRSVESLNAPGSALENQTRASFGSYHNDNGSLSKASIQRSRSPAQPPFSEQCMEPPDAATPVPVA